MKKIIAMVVIALTTLTMSAQESSKFTIKAGAGLSSVVGSDTDAQSIFAYKIGASYDLALSENFCIIPGIEYVAKGWKTETITGNINVSYLQIPVFAAYKFPISDNMKLAIKAGPYVSYGLFGSDIDWVKGGTDNVFDMFKRFDAGAIAGISLDFERFMVGFEYSRGFTKMHSDLKVYNQVFGVVLGYRF